MARRLGSAPNLFASAVLVAAAASGALVACGADAPPKPSDPVLAKGQELYTSRCATCHGPKGEGGTGKKLSGGVVTKSWPDVAGHRKVVANGISGTPMPAWNGVLTPEEIDAVVRYEREVLDKLP